MLVVNACILRRNFMDLFMNQYVLFCSNLGHGFGFVFLDFLGSSFVSLKIMILVHLIFKQGVVLVISKLTQ